jgi:predicted transcriptional regulator
MKDVKSMTKEELVAHIEELNNTIEKLSTKSDGRKAQVLDIIQREGKVSIGDIAAEIGISDRNVSSQLAYLRKDGWNFGKDSKKRIYIEAED